MAVSFIGGGNRSTRGKPPTCCKSLTNSITYTGVSSTPSLSGIRTHNVCGDSRFKCFSTNKIQPTFISIAYLYLYGFNYVRLQCTKYYHFASLESSAKWRLGPNSFNNLRSTNGVMPFKLLALR